MKTIINLYTSDKFGLPHVVYFETTHEALTYARRALKKDNESVRKVAWFGQDNSLNYTPLSDWHDAISVLQAL